MGGFFLATWLLIAGFWVSTIVGFELRHRRT